MNHVVITGRLVADPDIRYSQKSDGNQMAVANYTLAVDRRQHKQDGQQNADFIGCTAFDRQAEFVEKYLKKGTKIGVYGRLQSSSYINKDGIRVYQTKVLVSEHEFLESKNQANNGANQSNGTNYQGNAGNGQNQANNASGDGFMNIPDGVEDEQLPFN